MTYEGTKKCIRLILGRKHQYANECFDNNFVGVSFGINVNVKNDLHEDWRAFNKKFIPIYLEKNPDKSKVTAGLACGAIHTVAKAINKGDYIISPDGTGKYRIGEITGEYYFQENKSLLHCRPVKWLSIVVDKKEMSTELSNSVGSIGTVSNVTKHLSEIRRFINNESPITITAHDKDIEEPGIFALERHLEDFLVENWNQTELSNNYEIYKDDEVFGKQFPTDTGPIDILAISKDKKELLVIELKKGRASDSVVGQTQRYMGYIQDEFLEDGQVVKGIIIALDDDIKLRRALRMTTNIKFYRYKVSFSLVEK